MAKIMMSTGTVKYDVYEKWTGKLMGVCAEEAGKITNAYMASGEKEWEKGMKEVEKEAEKMMKDWMKKYQ